jgi:hypothetical protein
LTCAARPSSFSRAAPHEILQLPDHNQTVVSGKLAIRFKHSYIVDRKILPAKIFLESQQIPQDNIFNGVNAMLGEMGDRVLE